MTRPAPSPRSQPERTLLRDLVPLRPQGPVELVDRATHIFRTRFRDLAFVSLAVHLPIWLFLAIVLREDWARGLNDNLLWYWSSLVPEPFLGGLLAEDALGGGWIAAVLGRALPSVGLAVVGAASGHLLGSWSRGRPMTGPEALVAVARRGHRLLALWALVHLLEIGSVVGVVLGPFVFGIAAPLWALEGGTVTATIARSWRLSLRQLGRVLAAVTTATFVASLVTLLLGGALVLILFGFLGRWADLGGTAAVGLSGVLPHLVLDPLLAVSMALLAIDLRVRVEGADLEAELTELTSER